jgi:predicted O-methyltransferase YrrM
LLRDGPRSASDLATATGTNENALYRLLRALTNAEIFAEEPARRFALTPIGEFLRSDVPGSQRGFVRFLGYDPAWRPWGVLLHSIRTGEPAFEHVYGESTWDYLAKHPEESAILDGAMTSISSMESQAVVASYDFSSIGTLIDVGGGRGFLLGSILAANPSTKGILFDQEHVVADAKATLTELGVADRCRIVGGSFFDELPRGADAAILKHIIHDWDDDASQRILARCRDALTPGGRVLVAEMVVTPPGVPHYAKLLDLEMLVWQRGLERTEEEFARLFRSAGLRLVRVVPTPGPISVIEAVVE